MIPLSRLGVTAGMAEELVGISPDSVRAELQRIFASPRFDASERNRSFLAYVVEEALAGRTDRIKAYSIATSVFGRDASFDPQLDPIVRIEAGRLRRALERYYLTDGRTSRFRIDIPRGGYAPTFLSSEATGLTESPSGPPKVLVLAFEAEGDQSVFPSFTRGFTRSLIVALTRFTGLRVFGAESAFHLSGEVVYTIPSAGQSADYVVTGQTSLSATHFQVDALLVDAGTGRAVWAESYRRRLNPAEIISLRNEVANQVARELAQPYGAIQTDRVLDADGSAPEALDTYSAVLLFYAYWRTFDRTMIEAVRVALERAVTSEPEYSEALACLSLLHSNAHRFRHPLGRPEPDPRRRALDLAERAVKIAPHSSWARYALGLALWFSGNVTGALDALETGRTLNPNDTTILAELGQRYAMLAHWGDAVPLLEQSYVTNPAQPGSYRVGLFLYHFSQGRFAEALAEARLIDAPLVVYGHVAVAAAAGELGLETEAAKAVAEIRKIDPDYGAHVMTDLSTRHVARELITPLVAGLKKAGLAVTEGGLLH